VIQLKQELTPAKTHRLVLHIANVAAVLCTAVETNARILLCNSPQELKVFIVRRVIQNNPLPILEHLRLETVVGTVELLIGVVAGCKH
jgi:hypothetical protein